MRISIPVLVIGSALVVALQGAEHMGWLPDLLRPGAGPVLSNQNDDVLCGPKSLHIALNLLGIPVEPADVVSGCRTEPGGVSFGELGSYARSVGLRASLRRIDWDELAALETVCVLYVRPAHYVAIDSRSAKAPEGMLRYYDPHRVARWIDRAELERLWSGEALVLQADPKRDDVIVDALWNDIGFVVAETQAFRVAISNAGSTPRQLKIRGTSCNCTTATLTKETLERGEVAELVGQVTLKGRRGQFQERVEVAVEGWEHPVSVWFCGGRYADALCRTHEYLGEFIAGEKFERSFFVHDPGDETLKLRPEDFCVEFRTSDAGEDVPCSVACERVGDADPELGTRGLFVVKPGDFRITISGRMPARNTLQRLDGSLVLKCDLPAPLNVAKVRLSGRIVSRLQADPSALFVGTSEESQIAITNPKGPRPTLIGFECSDPGWRVSVTERRQPLRDGVTSGGPLSLDVRISPAGSLPSVSPCTLLLTTTEGEIAVPLIFTDLSADDVAEPSRPSLLEKTP